jgi:hypothetical protein
MAWGMKHPQFMVAETDYLIIRQIMLWHGQRIGIFIVYLVYPFPKLHGHQFLVGLVDFRQKSEMLVYQVIAIYVVVVGMGEQQSDGMQMLRLDILQQMPPLVRIIDTAIHNYGLSRLVGKYMRTFLARIRHPLLQLNHNAANFSFRMSTPATAVK